MHVQRSALPNQAFVCLEVLPPGITRRTGESHDHRSWSNARETTSGEPANDGPHSTDRKPLSDPTSTDDANLTDEEKAFLDYLVKQALLLSLGHPIRRF